MKKRTIRDDGVMPVPRGLRGGNIVAGIIDQNGSMRTVVTERSQLWAHPQANELVLVVPRFDVTCPVPWHSIPWVIKQAFTYVDWWVRTRNDPEFGGFKQNIAGYLKLRREEFLRNHPH